MVSTSKFSAIVPALLISLAAVPVLGGILRLVQMSGASIDFLPDSDRILAGASTIFVLHIVSAGYYCIVGAFQFSIGVRGRWPTWHRRMGIVVATAGLLVSMTGLWLTLFFPPASVDNALLYLVRLIVAPTMAVFIVFGIFDAKRRNFERHRAWMMRGYALGAGAGTQVLLLGPWTFLLAEPDNATRAILMGGGWAINLFIAEWFIYKRRSHRLRTSRVELALRSGI